MDTLRDDQEKIIGEIRESFREGYRRVVCEAPTGFGKTVVASAITRKAVEKGNRVLITMPLIILIEQTIKVLKRNGLIDIGVMQANHLLSNPKAEIQVASIQTLARRQLLHRPQLVIVDECHIQSEVIDNLMKKYPKTYFLGLSATPWAKGMAHRWEKLIKTQDIKTLILKGRLTKFRAYAPHIPDLTGVPVHGGDYSTQILKKVMDGKKLMGNIVQIWKKLASGVQTLCFCVNCDHAEETMHAFRCAGINAEVINHKSGPEIRDKIYQNYLSEKSLIICSVRTMTMGVDIPVGCVIDAAPTKSKMKLVQQIGRGMRKDEKYESLTIIDCAGNSIRHGLITDIQGKLTGDEKNKSVKTPYACPKCKILGEIKGIECSNCGYKPELSKKPSIKTIEAADGNLVKIDDWNYVFFDKVNFYSMALGYCEEKNYKKGYAVHLFREKFSVSVDENIKRRSKSIFPDKTFRNFITYLNIRKAKRKT